MCTVHAEDVRPRQLPAPAANGEANGHGGGVWASLNYIQPHTEKTEPFRHVHALPDGTSPTNMVYDPHTVNIQDLRTHGKHFRLHENGFQFEELPGVPDELDWTDAQQIKGQYYPLIAELIKRVSGASRVHVYEHTLRQGSVRTGAQGNSSKKRTPVPHIHVDYTTRSGVDRLWLEMPEEADTLSQRPFSIIQVWRPLRGPVKESPLALLDVKTTQKDDYMSARCIFETRFAFDYILKYNSDHRWYFAPGINADECYVFTCFQSRNDRARFTPHTSFTDPTWGPDVPPRESIECRAYAFWEDEPIQPIAREL